MNFLLQSNAIYTKSQIHYFQLNYISLWINYFNFPKNINVYTIAQRFPLAPLTLNISSNLFYFKYVTNQLLIAI